VEVWKRCDDADEFGSIVRLLILLGQRRSEIGDLAWPEVDLAKRQIELPEHRTKNHRPHIVPLSAPARRPGTMPASSQQERHKAMVPPFLISRQRT
jgi:integrase